MKYGRHYEWELILQYSSGPVQNPKSHEFVNASYPWDWSSREYNLKADQRVSSQGSDGTIVRARDAEYGLIVHEVPSTWSCALTSLGYLPENDNPCVFRVSDFHGSALPMNSIHPGGLLFGVVKFVIGCTKVPLRDHVWSPDVTVQSSRPSTTATEPPSSVYRFIPFLHGCIPRFPDHEIKPQVYGKAQERYRIFSSLLVFTPFVMVVYDGNELHHRLLQLLRRLGEGEVMERKTPNASTPSPSPIRSPWLLKEEARACVSIPNESHPPQLFILIDLRIMPSYHRRYVKIESLTLVIGKFGSDRN
ncbi:hypothetical protein EDC04DRAFT_2600909 [Pisolithus marmoratus]|nr:hypothetical protein EDC04DRAFT_2600909 [Pisolithus marmoratus]